MQIFHAICLDPGLHYLPTGHCILTERGRIVHDRKDTNIHCAGGLVIGSRSQHLGRLGGGQKQGRAGYISYACVLHSCRLDMLCELDMLVRRQKCNQTARE